MANYRMTRVEADLYRITSGGSVAGWTKRIGQVWHATDRGVTGMGSTPELAFSEFTRKRYEMDKAKTKRSLVRTSTDTLPDNIVRGKVVKPKAAAKPKPLPPLNLHVAPMPANGKRHDVASIPVVQFNLRRTA